MAVDYFLKIDGIPGESKDLKHPNEIQLVSWSAGYEQKAIPEAEERGVLRLVASRDGREGSVTIHQDADLYASRLLPGERVKHALADGRHAWLQMVRGRIELNGTALGAGDGAAVSQESGLEIVAVEPAHFLLFDLA